MDMGAASWNHQIMKNPDHLSAQVGVRGPHCPPSKGKPVHSRKSSVQTFPSGLEQTVTEVTRTLQSLSLSGFVALVLAACGGAEESELTGDLAAGRSGSGSVAVGPIDASYSGFLCKNNGVVESDGSVPQSLRLDDEGGVYQAAKSGDSGRITELLDKGLDMHKSGEICRALGTTIVCRPTPLHLAVRSGNIDAVNVLLDAGANVNAGIHDFRKPGIFAPFGPLAAKCIRDIGTPLSSATGRYVLQDPRIPIKMRMELQTALVKALLEEKADPNVKDELAKQPLSEVVRWGNVDAVRVLLEYEAHPNKRDGEGLTPLRRAILPTLGSNMDVIKVLLAFGAGDQTDIEFAESLGYRGTIIEEIRELIRKAEREGTFGE